MLLFWQSKITRFWQENLNVNVQFPMLSSCLCTILNTRNLMKKQGGSLETASRALQLFLSDYTTLASAHYLKISNWWWWAAHCAEQAVLKWPVWAEHDQLTAHMVPKIRGSQAAPSIYSGCHCISRHAIIAFPAEIQYIPNESHSADLTITGHSAQLFDQHNPSTVVNLKKRGKKKKRYIPSSIAR